MKPIIFLFCLMALFSGCATNQTRTVGELDRVNLHSQKIRSIQIIDELATISFQKGKSGVAVGVLAGGLIGGVIGGVMDSKRNTKKDTRLTLLLGLLGNYPPNEYLKASLASETLGTSFEHPVSFEKVDSTIDTNIIRVLPSYTLDPNLSSLKVQLQVGISQKVANGNSNYENTYVSEQSIGRAGELDANRFWLMEHPDELVAAINAGLTVVVQKLISDFNGVKYVPSKRASAEYPVFEPTNKNVLNTKTQTDQLSFTTNYQNIVVGIDLSNSTTLRTNAQTHKRT